MTPRKYTDAEKRAILTEARETARLLLEKLEQLAALDAETAEAPE